MKLTKLLHQMLLVQKEHKVLRSVEPTLIQDVEGGGIAARLRSDNAITCVVSGRGRCACSIKTMELR